MQEIIEMVTLVLGDNNLLKAVPHLEGFTLMVIHDQLNNNLSLVRAHGRFDQASMESETVQ